MQARVITGDLSRRRFLAKAGGGIGVIAAPGLMRIAAAQSWRAGNPFSLGVASGAWLTDPPHATSASVVEDGFLVPRPCGRRSRRAHRLQDGAEEVLFGHGPFELHTIVDDDLRHAHDPVGARQLGKLDLDPGP